MQNKGAVKLFAILLVLAGLYSLSFTFFTKKVEDKAREIAATIDVDGKVYVDKSKENRYLDSIKSEVVYNFLWMRKFTYAECKEKELNFGLDLKGGMNVTLEVSVVDLIKSLSTNPTDETLIKAIERASELENNSQEGFVVLFGKAFAEVSNQGRLAPYFSTIENKDRVQFDSSNEDVIAFLGKEAQSAIENSFNILRTRIDRFGVTQPNIQSLGGGRILVELPGVTEPERVRKLLQGTAKLEFWETYESQEIYQYLADANQRIKEIRDLQKIDNNGIQNEVVEDSLNVDTLTVNANANDSVDVAGADASLVDQLKETSDTLGASENNQENAPLFSKLIVTPDGQSLFPGPVAGIAHVKDTAEINAMLSMEQVKRIFPRNLKFLWTIKSYDKEGNFFQLISIKETRSGKAPLDGDAITNASLDYGQTGAQAGVSMVMSSEGASIWARLTKENIQRSIAIVLDGYVYSFPTVQNEITGGRSQISGNFTVAEATDLANVLKSGKLPAPARIVEEVVVGPSLGKQAINSGLWSFIIAFIIVLGYMIFYYNKAGYVANIALLTNVFLIFGVLASLGAVLTLPGIAGIVLTIGMSVDANVLIFERIREELTNGKGIKIAIADGYKNAYSAIIDANVTTLIIGIILYNFGSGPIQGFATTLIIGIITSLFCAIFITRLVFDKMLDSKKDIAFDTKLTRNIFKNVNFSFIEKRKKFYIFSSIIIVVGLVSMASKGWDVGVDFVGGRSYVVNFQKTVQTSEIATILSDAFEGDVPNVKIYGENSQVKITTKYLINDKSANADSIVEAKLYEGLLPILGNDISFDNFIDDYRMSSQKVGPTIAHDIIIGAIISVILALIFLFLYIFIRFRNWQYGLGAVAALFHDVLIVLGIFSIFHGILPFSLEIDQAFIAAILTVIGYSINDTVVVFDRIREFKFNFPKRDTLSLVNQGLNSTLSRTFSTSLSTFVVLLAMFIFGGETIRGFIFAMLIGVVVGTYSSLFIASPIMFDFYKKKELKK
jgi:SecD/SecF fusion protein